MPDDLDRRHQDIRMSVFLEARSLYIPHENNPRHWIWTWDSGHEVVELQNVCWLEIKGMVDTTCLLKMTCYSAYLVFKLKQSTQWIDTALTSVRYLKDKWSYCESRRCQVFLTKSKSSKDPGQFPNIRQDRWMEIKLGEFYVTSGNEGEVEMRLWNTENIHWKSGLIVWGIDVRPC
ncbi:putative F-box protein PP2-B12 [Ipomoea triloba]|uniref:putative F-box protein PP2-B12 n=1 Tax=Ipomoea triloba TaxID=35885 RepID=UPI00125DBAC0|nr:putative F-box protein PP2-B12 [Ipomoea triloba]